MKRFFLFLTLVAILVAMWFYVGNPQAFLFAPTNQTEQIAPSINVDVATGDQTSGQSRSIKEVATNLDVPWGIDFLPSGNLLVTERSGRLLELTPQGDIIAEQEISTATQTGEGGLLGVAVHSNFSENNFLYLYETFQAVDGTENRVERFTYTDGALSNRITIVDGIDGASYHDGGRMIFGADDHLYIATGDAGNPESAQDPQSLSGKILRLHEDGSIPEENISGTAVYSSGHRNPQGLAFDDAGRLWSSEHGRSGARSGLDEINQIVAGGNYGWPYFEGDEVCGQSSIYGPQAPASITGASCPVLPPALHSGENITWAPASLAHNDGRLFWGGLRGQALYVAEITEDGGGVGFWLPTAFLKEHFGRIRSVVVDPSGEYLWVTTSNTDGRGSPQAGDDKLLKIPLSVVSVR